MSEALASLNYEQEAAAARSEALAIHSRSKQESTALEEVELETAIDEAVCFASR